MWSNLILVFISLVSNASLIDKVKGNKAIILMQEETFNLGDKVFAIDEDGKKRAALTIMRVQGSKAQAEIIKGKANPGMAVILRSSSGENRSLSKVQVGRKKMSGRRVGIIGGVSQNAMSITTGNNSGRFSGTSWTFSGLLDLPISEALTIRGKAGLNQFSVARGGAGASFSYLGFEGGLNWNINKSFWVGGGGAFLLTATRSSNIVGLDARAATNSFFFVGGGSNISIGRNKYIPISIDYALFPGGAGVSANSLIIRAGYAWDY